MTSVALTRTVYRAENPLKAIAFDVLETERGIIKIPLLALRIRHEYQRCGGDCGAPEWQEFGLRGFCQWLATTVKRRGFYDLSARGYRTYVGSNARQIRAGAQYKRQKGDENYGAADAMDRLADLLPSPESVVTPEQFRTFRRDLATDDGDA